MARPPLAPPPKPLPYQTDAAAAASLKNLGDESNRAAKAHAHRSIWPQRRSRVRHCVHRIAGAVLVAAACALGVWWAAGQSGWPSDLLARVPHPSHIAAWLRQPDLAQLPGLPARWNPWVALTLQEPDGPLTPWKIGRLQASPASCLQWLADAPDLVSTPLPDRRLDTARLQAANGGDHCGWQTASRISAMGRTQFSSPFTLTCSAAVALARWERHVLQPAARSRLGTSVVRIEHLGSYACRPIVGSAGTGRLSEHAHANALDVAAFILADGRRISVQKDWQAHADEAQVGSAAEAAASGSEGDPLTDQRFTSMLQKTLRFATPEPANPALNPKASFLRQVRDGACHGFAAVLGPDYNAAHRDHFHLDRGPYRVCR